MVSVVAATYCGYFVSNNYVLRYFVLLDLSNRNFGVGRFIFIVMAKKESKYVTKQHLNQLLDDIYRTNCELFDRISCLKWIIIILSIVVIIIALK